MTPIAQASTAARFWLLLASLALAGPAAAQTGGYTGAFTRIGFDPVGMAMGNAVSAWEGSGASAYHNPAFAVRDSGSIRIQTAAAALTHGRKLAAFDATLPLPPSAGIRLGLLHMGIDGIDGRSQSGYPTGELTTSELQAAAAFALRLGPSFHAGVGIKWNSSRLHERVPRASTLAIDLGLRLRLHERHSLALVLQDLLGSYTWDTGELYGSEQSFSDSQDFPRRMRLGYHFAASDKVNLTWEGELRRQSVLVPVRSVDLSGGYPRVSVSEEENVDRSLLTRLGAAWTVVPVLTLRGGVESGDLLFETPWRVSSGFSLRLPELPLQPVAHYAFRTEPGMAGMVHALSFTIQL